MMIARHWLFRASIAGNAFVIFYIAIYSSTKFNPPPTSVPVHFNVQPSRRYDSLSQSIAFGQVPFAVNEVLPAPYAISSSQVPSKIQAITLEPSREQLKLSGGVDEKEKQVEGLLRNTQKLFSENAPDVGRKLALQESPASREVAHMDFDSVDMSSVPEEKVLVSVDDEIDKSDQFEPVRLFPCDDYTPDTHFGQRGPFWVLYNYVKPRKQFRCDESMTYTTHADFTFLDNLIPLLERWEGPVSLAIYSPGTDFNNTLKRINYLRECVNGSSLVKDYVNFHLFFDYKHTPKTNISQDPTQFPVNCSSFKPSDIAFGENLSTYRKEKKLPYPVNVARNVAREMSTTYYILPSDIELYPNPNLIPDFLDMIRRNDTPELQRPNPNKLFVLSIFEIEANVTALPHDKTELVYMLRNKTAIPFHKYVCAMCHRIPKAKEWIDFPVFPGLNTFHIGKRYKPFHHWEPIFIGTIRDPFYDERLTWEGRSDKMTQGYILCVLDYEFHILDNAFLIHRPGIKRTITIPSKVPVVARQNSVISKIILPELHQLFGKKSGCYV